VVFAAVAWGLGPHWAVAGFCALAATFIALVAVERDGLAPPLSVAVIGAGVALALLVAAGLADHRHTRVLDAVIGTVVAGALALVAGKRSDQTGTNPWTAAAPVLLPAGTALGWLGPAAAGEGLATTIVVLLVTVGARHKRPAGTADGRSSRGVLGAALVAGVVVATVVAVATGAGAGT
jgi:hypothetical protein